MDKRLLLILPWLTVTPLAAKQKEKQEVAPLDEEFLLFLAEMESVDGDWVHPVDLKTQQQEVAKADTKAEKVMKNRNKGEQDDIK